jgi:hypothetical protein
LTAIGWVTRSADGQHCTTLAVAECAVSDTLAALCADVYGEVAAEDLLSSSSAEAWGHHLPRLAKHLPSIQTGWILPALAADVPRLPTMLAGAVIAPLLLELRMLSSAYTAKASEGKHEHASAQVSLALVDESTAAAVGRAQYDRLREVFPVKHAVQARAGHPEEALQVLGCIKNEIRMGHRSLLP